MGQRPELSDLLVLATRWDDGWDLYVLDPIQGLIGQVRSTSDIDFEREVRTHLRQSWMSYEEQPITILRRT